MFDVHCHIIPDVDDGSRDMRESVAMLKEARASGIDRIVCTPHCRSSKFNYERIVDHFEALYAQAEQMGIQLDLGFEVYWEKLAELGLDTASALCFENTNLMLLEFSCGSLPASWQRIVYELQGAGIQLIIAHPERYRPVQRNIEIAYEMKEMGCLLQLSGNFVEGGWRSQRRKTALELLKNNLVDYIASDAHCPEDYESYRKALQIAQKY
ncbi:tyrosine-protein phosphatase [Adlercreutzia sp. ZJ473]|uniref:tyrosine-protein phosphatase n=1 Tax=Adlercreutzia sp. ZJ473 TaxID=2722822 RepID=UPI0015544BDA|nr:CpsB/CapC family capsule biosynthesis tyrosine phosphatase [Adlercreutzia sp. ZJ473]